MPEARIVRRGDGEVARGGSIPWLFKSDTRIGGEFDFMVGEVPYLSGPPLHFHRSQADTFYILENVLAIQIGDVIQDLEPGDFASVPPGVWHTFDNVRADQAPVKAINLMVPGGLDIFLEQLGALGDSPSDSEVSLIADGNGVTFVGPPLRVQLGLAED